MKKLSFTLIVVLATTFTFSQRGTGLLFNENEYQEIEEPTRQLGWGADLPKRVSLREFVPSIIGNQGNFGTCVGWSSTYYVATMEYAIGMNMTNQREIASNVFDPYYTYLSCTSTEDYFECGRGLQNYRACEHLVNKGVKRFSYDTYTCGAKIADRVKETNSVIDFTDYYRIFDRDDSFGDNIMAVQQALADNHPVLFGMYLPMSFDNIGSDGLLTTVEGEGTEGGHAMTIVGYDDTLYGGCFTVVNSWGNDWGNEGFFYLRYSDYIQHCNGTHYLVSEIKDIDNGSGCVYGDCNDGYGRYVCENGDVYEGDFVSGNRAGHGAYFWKNDFSHFGGEWQDNKRHGYGVYTAGDANSLGIYWNEGEYNSYQYVENDITQSDFIDATNINELLNFSNSVDLAERLSDADFLNQLNKAKKLGKEEFHECVYGDCYNGVGMYLSIDKFVYMGHFKNGAIHGQGSLYWLGEGLGHAYVGERYYGTQDGIGTYFYPSGAKYFGEWQGGNRHGSGAMFHSDGNVSAGEWINGEFEDDSFGFGDSDKYDILEETIVKPEVSDGKTVEK